MRYKSRCEVSGRNTLSAILCAAGLLPVWFAAPVAAEEKEPEQKVVREDRSYATFEAQEMIVTAQKQEEELKDVPISVSVMTGYDVEDKHIDGIWKLADHIPSLMIFDTGMTDMFAQPSMRGVSAPANTFSSSVGLYVDGVPIVASQGYITGLLDIERIEVLRGPQGTLYGKNTEAGAINVITRQPDDEWRGRIGGEIGEDNKRLIMGTLSGPLVQEKLFFSLAGQFDSKDGFIKNTYLGGADDDRERYYGRAQLRWTPSPDWDISLIMSRLFADEGSGAIVGGDNLHAMLGTVKPPERTVSSDLRPEKEAYNDIHSLKIAYDVNDSMRLTSITARKMTDWEAMADFDFVSMPIYHVYSQYEFSNVSQEFRLNWQSGRMRGQLSLYGDSHVNDMVVGSILPGNSRMRTTDREITGDSYAVYGQVDYSLTDAINVIGGLRYERQNMEYEDALLLSDGDESWEKITPKFGLRYRLTPEINMYATIAEGYRTGGFNNTVTDLEFLTYDPEELWNYEVGVKTSFLENRLLVNASIYYMDIQNMQVEEWVTPVTTYVTNAAEATAKGVEIELTARVLEGLTITAGLGYNDTTFDTFEDALGDYSGNKNPFAPEYTFNLGAMYRHGKGLFLSADLVGYGDMYIDKDNKDIRESYELVNAKIGYEFDQFDVYVYAYNLFDAKYDSVNYYGFYDIYSPPREIGLQLAYRL